MIEAGKQSFAVQVTLRILIQFLGGTFGPGLYGATLIKTGLTEQKLGQVERDFIANTGMRFIQPLRK